MPSMPSEALLDVNVVVAAVFADHPMHEPRGDLSPACDAFAPPPSLVLFVVS